jgi:hypothetical protein
MAMEVNSHSKAYNNNFHSVIPMFRFQYARISLAKLESFPKVNYIIHGINVLFAPNNITPQKHYLLMLESDINDLLSKNCNLLHMTLIYLKCSGQFEQSTVSQKPWILRPEP